ncbi:DUF952 domain-containing protein [Roseococcus suduntuyensis]|uniref:Uncharacterized protein (DUF952 family) n=1 Tax=Roseococcus suduntuyensis TaxID=455361 RepID=A0A840AA29_9PROT|nr:DUF952 domain-containing protein [Roseococcus suduntuyensis]MBB3897154.1 uncharacterized protein (DUF952 family) [Roseococcus suduntuyensis]
MERFIYTLIRGADWREAETHGEYRGSADDRRDGFLHFSTAAQLRATAAKHRAGEADLWMIEAECAALGDALRWEPASGSSRPGLFPHLYAPLPLSAVRRALHVPLDAEGRHAFPEDVP